jgi:hypothetical protein
MGREPGVIIERLNLADGIPKNKNHRDRQQTFVARHQRDSYVTPKQISED